jgi:hypothetical protein
MKHKVAVHCLPLKKVLLLVVVVDHMQADERGLRRLEAKASASCTGSG